MFSDRGNNTEHYDTLGVSSNASETQIKKAYHKLAKTHHPDKKNGDDTEFKKITKALLPYIWDKTFLHFPLPIYVIQYLELLLKSLNMIYVSRYFIQPFIRKGMRSL